MNKNKIETLTRFVEVMTVVLTGLVLAFITTAINLRTGNWWAALAGGLSATICLSPLLIKLLRFVDRPTCDVHGAGAERSWRCCACLQRYYRNHRKFPYPENHSYSVTTCRRCHHPRCQDSEAVEQLRYANEKLTAETCQLNLQIVNLRRQSTYRRDAS